MLKISIVVGNPKPNSRTLHISQKLVSTLIGTAAANVETIDLVDHQSTLFDWPSDTMAALSARVAESDLIIVASPTYKASYTGLLKAFLDRYPANALNGIVAIPVMTGNDATHSMGGDSHLAPLLTELGSIVLGRSLYFMTSQMDQMDAIISKRAQELRERLKALAAITQTLSTVTDAKEA